MKRLLLFVAVGFSVLIPARSAAELAIVPDKLPASAPAPAPEITELPPGATAPDFTTVDLAGAPVKLSDFAGKIIVLDFWATWCGPCLISLPHTERMAVATKSQGVVVLASCTFDTRENFEPWLKKNAAKYPHLIFSHDPVGNTPDGAAAKLYGVTGVPAQFVIGRDGKIAAVITGFGEDDPRLEAALKKLGVRFAPAALRR